ncbi:MAG: Mur ligase family protein [Acutalibacteraceae bacterium]
MCVVGITGTNGKTTSTYLLKHVLEQTLGAKVGLIGTIQNMIGDEILHTERTTPESFELQKLFADMRDAGCTQVIMEVSSHALVLHRADQIRFGAAVFTNLTEDHLDFHQTMDAYCDAKAMLFRRCETGAVNVDDAYAKRIMRAGGLPPSDVFRAGNPRCTHGGAYRPRSPTAWSLTRSIRTSGLPSRSAFPAFSASITPSASSAAALAPHIPLAEIADALRTAQSVKGRVEVVPTPGKDYTVLIDYSHTPDSLENILRAVRGFCTGRIIAVFGCGGDRDPFKRPVMGKIAAELSDLAIVTSDNPRTEDPYKILRQILAGMQDTETPYEVIESRVSAIGRAMELAQKDDVIVLCGKSHETYQEIGHEKHHLDEREVVASYLEANA